MAETSEAMDCSNEAVSSQLDTAAFAEAAVDKDTFREGSTVVITDDDDDDDNSRKISLTVKTPQDKKLVRITPDADTKKLRQVTGQAFNVSDDRLCFIYSGKVLQDEDLLAQNGIQDGSTIHLVIKSTLAQGGSQHPASMDEETGEKPPYGPMHFAHIGIEPLNYAQLQQHMQRQMLSNPELIRQMVQNPLVQQLMANPSVITELITSNPHSKDWLKRNPELAEMLENKEIMQQTLEISNNPEMLNELITAQSRGKMQFMNNAAATAGANKYGAAANLPELQTIWHHLAQKPQVLQQMFSAPYTKTFLEGLSANSEVTQQMIANQQLFASNPVLQQQMQCMMPFYLQQLQNPTMQSMMTNGKAMQAMIKIQHGLEMLHSEAPGLVGSFGLPYLSQPPSLATFAPSPSDAAGGNTTGASAADSMSNVLSQMIAQMASGGINQPPEERFKDQLDQLAAMGFNDRQKNVQVLVGTFGDLSAAVQQLNRQQS